MGAGPRAAEPPAGAPDGQSAAEQDEPRPAAAPQNGVAGSTEPAKDDDERSGPEQPRWRPHPAVAARVPRADR